MLITILEPSINDVFEFITTMKDSCEYHTPWIEAPKTQQEFATYLSKYNQVNNKSFLIKYDDKIAGVVNLNEIVMGCFKSAYLGFYGTKQFAGLGIMQVGLQLVIHRAFNELGLHRLEANIQPNNVRSLNLVKKLGFSKEGFSSKYLYIGNQWCDHERWAIINED